MHYIPDSKDLDAKAAKGITPLQKVIVGAVTLGLVFFSLKVYWSTSDYMIEALSSKSPNTRKWAVMELSKKGDIVGPKLIDLLKQRKIDEEAKRLALYVLGKVRFKDAKDLAVEIFHNGSPPLREQAAFALGMIGDSSVLNDLTDAYHRAPKRLKVIILNALGEIGNKAGAMTVMKALNSKDEAIQKAAARALKKIKKKSKI